MSSVPYIDIHTHHVISDKEVLSVVNLNITDTKPKLDGKQAFSIGIHPWDIEKLQPESASDYLNDQCASMNPVAIGEIGLDKLIATDMKIQEKIFVEQLQIAKFQQKPVIIHCVKAQEELLKVKQKNDTGTAWIFHGYNKNLQVAKTFLKHGFYLSFGEALLKNEKLQSVCKQIPVDRIFLETDNKNISIKEVYAKVAEIKEIEIEALKKQMLLNYMKYF